ncbi:2-succinyl-6-hydroxy-2,4-cyclohexadiene-1-carboxylate synthase [Bombilactobacillus bombi]|uniref:2-succinyl-6-hydroxy-2, 4-cyclohexadiene-1-carboxylate synthase n=1 Tax=Bombilactobacillus bombi TaxID=1303590 RepID=UPI0035E95AD7
MQIKINHATYSLKITGVGAPVWLLLHGFMGSKYDFDNIRSALPGQVITLDLLGHGQTICDLTPTRLAFSQQIKDLQIFLEKYFTQPINLVGYSMGGRLALGLAISAPQLIAQLFLENCTAGIADRQKQQSRQHQDALLAQQLRQKSLEQFIDNWENLPLFASQKNLSTKLQQQIRLQRQHQNPLALAASLEGMGTGVMPNYWPQLAQLTLPTTIITGDLDAKFQKITAQMTALLPHAHRFVVTNAGHNVHLEQPNQYLTILQEHSYAN